MKTITHSLTELRLIEKAGVLLLVLGLAFAPVIPAFAVDLPEPELPSLKLVKIVDGGLAVPGDWTLTATGDDDGSRDFSDEGDSNAFHDVNISVVYTLTESDVPNYEYTDLNCDGGEAVGDYELMLSEGDHVTCTFENTYVGPVCEDNSALNYEAFEECEYPEEEGSITIYKVTDDESGESIEFDFSGTGGIGSFGVLGDDLNNEIFSLPAGSYTIEELVEDNWSFDTVECSCDDEVLTEDGVTVELDPGENIECTFYNTKDEVDDTTITIVKQTTPDADTTGFDFILDNSLTAFATLSDGQSSGAVEVSVGAHTITEVGLSDWNLTDIACYEQVGEGQIAVEGIEGEGATTIAFESGDDIICTFYNEKVGVPTYTIGGYKFEDEDGNGEWGEGESALAGWTIFLDEDENGTLDEGELSTVTDENGYYEFEVEAGSYDVNEVQQNGWSQTAPEGGSCFFNVGQYEYQRISLVLFDEIDYGPNYRCDFGNHRNPEELSCSLSVNDSSVSDGTEVTLTWETNQATNVSIDQGIGEVDLDGSTGFMIENDITFTLTASNSETEDSVTCQTSVDEESGGGGGGGGKRISMSGGGSNDDDEPVPEVLGEQTAILPAGAPNTGAGGAAPIAPAVSLVLSFASILLGVFGLRRSVSF